MTHRSLLRASLIFLGAFSLFGGCSSGGGGVTTDGGSGGGRPEGGAGHDGGTAGGASGSGAGGGASGAGGGGAGAAGAPSDGGMDSADASATPTLTALVVAAGSATAALSRGTSPGVLTGTDTFTATGTFSDGRSQDLTAAVGWSVQPSSGAAFSGATVSFSAPGTYTVIATSGGVTSNPVTVEATFSGDFVCTDLGTTGSCASVDPGSKTGLQGTPAGGVGIAYPLANALFTLEPRPDAGPDLGRRDGGPHRLSHLRHDEPEHRLLRQL